MARGRATDYLGPDRGHPAIRSLLVRNYHPRFLAGWDAIRLFLGNAGVRPPDGPSTACLQDWRRRRGFPAVFGRGRRLPIASDLAMIAWAYENAVVWATRGQRRHNS